MPKPQPVVVKEPDPPKPPPPPPPDLRPDYQKSFQSATSTVDSIFKETGVDQTRSAFDYTRLSNSLFTGNADPDTVRRESVGLVAKYKEEDAAAAA